MSRTLLFSLALLAACNHDDTEDTELQLAPAPSLRITHADVELTDLALEAVALAPSWVQDDLIISLSKLDPDEQNELGALVVDLDEPWLTDEVCFSIAHTSPEVLDYRSFYPELFVENAELVYAYDEDLDYVELIDEGEPGVDPDYYTTASYVVGLEDGSEVTARIDPEVYYWFVVHPRLEDELPEYLDAWSSSSPVKPEQGMFWREFLWDGADDECPAGRECLLLRDYVTTETRLWNSEAWEVDGNAAIGRLIRFVQDAIDFGAGDERPIQPSRIYTVAAGNCGEHADLSCAIARTALIPCHNVGAKSNDHTWNEFWDPAGEQWMQWEPIGNSVGKWTYYVDDQGDYYRTLDTRDNDCDGRADEGRGSRGDAEDHDADGVSVDDGDCDDTDASIFPGAPEVPNGRDDDCDGDADEGLSAEAVDADGDGYTLADGDCDDLDALRYPGAPDEVDGIDDDCDGVADDGSDTADADGDGWSVADGDCDDTDAEVHPEAVELANGRDDDCDGWESLDFDAYDRDGDGYTVADGDCDDTHADAHPGVDDPSISRNRLFMITAYRGDTWTGSDRTAAYGTTASIEFTVTDEKDRPVDGAVVNVYGNWSVYGYPNAPAWAGEAVTDLDGKAEVLVGEANDYDWAVTSSIGDAPGGAQLLRGPRWTEPGETYTASTFVNGKLPASPRPRSTPWEGEADMQLSVDLSVESHRIQGDGGYYYLDGNDYLYGSFSVSREGGRVDVFVVDDEGLAGFEAGEAFDAVLVAEDLVSDALVAELPEDRAWHLVLANTDTNASTMVGSLSVEVAPLGDEVWAEGTLTHAQRFRIPPGSWLTLTLGGEE